MNGYSARFAGAAVLWTGALSLGIVGSVESDLRLMFWSVMAALTACMVTGHIVAENAVRKERIRVEDLVDGLILRARERADSEVPRVH